MWFHFYKEIRVYLESKYDISFNVWFYKSLCIIFMCIHTFLYFNGTNSSSFFASVFYTSFRLNKYNLPLYKRLVAFVMSYSFTENQDSPSMVPMADMLNHASSNNAHLTYEQDHLKMVALEKIEPVSNMLDDQDGISYYYNQIHS